VKLIGIDLSIGSKSHVDMSNAIFIDDVSKHLLESNCKYPIIFGDEYPWNTGTNLLRCYNWTEVKKYILNL
jgi:5'(3')-deoxyribonucleotidase